MGPKRFFCPGCWAAAWTSTTSSGPTYSRPPSGTSGRSCTERDCLLSSTNGMKNFYLDFIALTRSKKNHHYMVERPHMKLLIIQYKRSILFERYQKSRKWNVDIWIIVNKYVILLGIYFLCCFCWVHLLENAQKYQCKCTQTKKQEEKTIFVVIYLSIFK